MNSTTLKLIQKTINLKMLKETVKINVSKLSSIIVKVIEKSRYKASGKVFYFTKINDVKLF